MPETTRQSSSPVSGSGPVEVGLAAKLGHHDPYGLCGRVVDERYHVERVVDQGGFGVIYRAHHLLFDSPVALKVLRTEGTRTGEHSDFQRRLVLEGKLLFGLSSLHPSIVRVYEMGTLGAEAKFAPYLALEWLEGVSLAEELRERTRRGVEPYSLEQALDLLEGVVRALSLSHARRIAHRDIKPGNIFLARQGERLTPKILDFGLAKVMDGLATTAELYAESVSVERSFTPAYAAPEQWLKRIGATGTWSDVFSLALVLVELMVGQRPLAGDDTTQLLAACIDPNVRPTPRTLGVPVSDAVEVVFARALAVHPRERYRDAGELWRALCIATDREDTGAAEAALDVVAEGQHTLDELGREPTADLPERALAVPRAATASVQPPRAGSRRGGWTLWLVLSLVGVVCVLGLRGPFASRHKPQLRPEPGATHAAHAAKVAEVAPIDLPVQPTPELPATLAPTLPSSAPEAEPPRDTARKATHVSASKPPRPRPNAPTLEPAVVSAGSFELPPPAPPSPAAPRTAEELLNDDELMLRR